MSITFFCENCGKRLKANEAHAGRTARCSGCGTPTLVPRESATVPAAARPATASSAANDGKESDEKFFFGKLMKRDDALDMTPMVDMTFLLMIFFLFTFAMNLQKSMEFPPPDPSDEAALTKTVVELEQEEEFVMVRIDAENTIWVNDVVAFTPQDLLFKLREGRGSDARDSGKMMVLAHGDAHHEMIVMALDMGTEAGMEDVRLSMFEESF